MWEVMRELVAAGTTLLLTTQYLEEADELADEIVVIDHGRVIAAGTAAELKNRIGGDILEFAVVDKSRLGEAAEAISSLSDADTGIDDESATVTLKVGDNGSQALVETVRRLDALGIHTDGLGIRRPSLDDVFLSLTGRAAEEIDADSKQRQRRSKRHQKTQVS